MLHRISLFLSSDLPIPRSHIYIEIVLRKAVNKGTCMSNSTANPYQKALIGAAAVAFLYILLLAFAATRRIENEFEAGNWGYVLGLFVFTTLIGTLAAGYWTQKSSKDLSFARVALRGAAIAFCLLLLQGIGKFAEQREMLVARTEAIAQWKLKPMPVQAAWPEGWRVQPVSFEDQLSGFIQVAERETANAVSFASLACAYRSTLSADRRFDEMLKGTADGFFAKFKAQGIELVSGATGDGAIGPYAGRRLEFDNKGGAVSLHGEIVTADAPACRLLIIAYHVGEPYDAMKGVIDRFKASVK